MKNIRHNYIFLWILGWTFLLILTTRVYAAPSEIKKISVVMDDNYPPYSFRDSQGDLQGIALDQWKLFEKKTGIKVNITGMTWNKAYEGMTNGEFDVIDTISYSAERTKIFDCSQSKWDLCQSMGEALGLREGEVQELKSVGLLNDIGKIAISENILNKPEKLTNDEWEEIKRHPEIGYRILSTVNGMAKMAEYVLAHHERWDGLGYPKGLKGEELPLQPRIIAIADAYDAMTSVRSYRGALSEELAIAELQKNAGTQFDLELVELFIDKVINIEIQL